MGIFLELGKLVDLPTQQNVIMAIYDARQNRGGEPLLIYHPLLGEFLDEKLDEIEADKNIPPIDDLLPSANLEIIEHDDKQPIFIKLSQYHDALEETGETEQYLAVRNSEPIFDGLYVIIQMQMKTIEAPAKVLRTKLILLGLSVVGFSAAILIPMWIIILRRVIKE